MKQSSTKLAFGFIILMGIVSLFSDMTYEGARSLNGSFLNYLGASAAAVGIAAGAGELLGYGLRFFTGAIADRTRRYWLLVFLGYFTNLLAPPLLALVGRWEIAVGLIFMERIGKAIRNPSRDAMLSHAASQVGSGIGFGLHEALDQIGAFLGPLLVSAVLFWQSRGTGAASLETFHAGYAFLFIPALFALVVLGFSRIRFPKPGELESKTPKVGVQGLPPAYWWYLAGAGLVAAGFADFPLMAYHFQKTSLLAPHAIPALYSGAMAVDALSALVFGRWYDRQGLRVVAFALGTSAFFAPLAFLGGRDVAITGVLVWGLGMGAQESIMRAAVANFTPPDRRATGFGLFYTFFGIAWFLGSATLGFLYDHSRTALVIFSLVLQLTAIPLILVAAQKSKPSPEKQTL